MYPAVSVNEYTRMMVEAFDEQKAIIAPTAFQGSFYGKPETGAVTVFAPNSMIIEIDILRRNGRRLARLVNRGTSSDDILRKKTQTGDKFTNIARAWPLVETDGAINSDELLKRLPGEMPYSKTTRQDRLVAKAMRSHFEQMNQHIHMMEYLCREALLTGEHPAILGTTNTDLIYDFYRNAGNSITVSNSWNSGSQTIMADIDSGIDPIQQNAYLYGDYGMLLGTDAFGDLRNDTAIKALAENRRFFFVELGGQIRELPVEFHIYRNNGFQPRGYLETDKGRRVWIFTYDLTFTDDFTTPGSDVETPWMPTDKALIFSPKARCDRYFGPPDRLPFTADEIAWYQETFGFNMTAPPMPAKVQNTGVVDARMFYCDGYTGPDRKTVVARTQSAPIMPTTQTDAFAVLSGLHT
jgi:hypothetical protein